jgi:hypothetical protein
MLRVRPGKMVRPADLGPALVAPCGMNCGLCMRFLRARDTCTGCRLGDEGKLKSCLACPIRTCDRLRASQSGLCTDCAKLPCDRIKRMDTRYRKKYRMSVVENLEAIRAVGIEAFVESERERWACPDCGCIQCMHTAQCIYCGYVWA